MLGEIARLILASNSLSNHNLKCLSNALSKRKNGIFLFLKNGHKTLKIFAPSVELFDKVIKTYYHLNKNRVGHMKKYYLAQLVIDFVMIILGFIIFMFPSVAGLSANMVFYTMMSIYAGLELCEYFLSEKSSNESLYLFIASATGAFSGFFLRNYPSNGVLSVTLIVWILMVSIIKIMGFETIYKKKTNLFIIKLSAMSILILIALMVSVNIYFRISTIGYMLTLLYMSYGVLELICDGLDYLSVNSSFLKE